MLFPTRYEKLDQNILVVGADAIRILRKRKYSIEGLYQVMKKEKRINLERFFSILSFLWITEIIDLDDFYISLKKQHVS